MVPAPLPDLDGLDPETLKALLIAKHNESVEQHKQLRSNSQEIDVSSLCCSIDSKCLAITSAFKVSGSSPSRSGKEAGIMTAVCHETRWKSSTKAA
jgi:hypothetical protein